MTVLREEFLRLAERQENLFNTAKDEFVKDAAVNPEGAARWRLAAVAELQCKHAHLSRLKKFAEDADCDFEAKLQEWMSEQEERVMEGWTLSNSTCAITNALSVEETKATGSLVMELKLLVKWSAERES